MGLTMDYTTPPGPNWHLTSVRTPPKPGEYNTRFRFGGSRPALRVWTGLSWCSLLDGLPLRRAKNIGGMWWEDSAC
jgi:hypothetical protein